MRVSFDKLPQGRTVPLTRATAKRFLRAIAPPELLDRIVRLHFGCNQRTTQEARIVSRGRTFEIRVNFCLDHGQSRLVSSKPGWLRIIEFAGGSIARPERRVVWTPEAARRYCAFLIAHEVAHVIYARRSGVDTFTSPKGTPTEEAWCDEWAIAAVERCRDVW